jgi:glycosyltransferase involved in cell wall biosynthesis
MNAGECPGSRSYIQTSSGMRSRPPLLFLTPVTPADWGNGLAMRAGLFLEGLARSHDVRVLVAPVFGSAAPPGSLVTRCASSFDVLELERTTDPIPDLTARLSTPAGRNREQALHPRPMIARLASTTACRAVVDAASECVAIHVMRLYLAPFLDALLDSDMRPAIALDLDELESAYARLEAYYLPLVDRIVVAAAEDLEVSQRHRGVRVTCVPNAVRIPEPAAVHGDAAPARTSDLLFVGNLSHPPNIEGARWLVDEVLPRLGASVGLSLVGSRPSEEIRALADGVRITIAADVTSVSPWYTSSRVAVAPLFTGGGTRIKVIEALAHGLPVVATRNGARGLDQGLTAGSGGQLPVLIADEPQAFALACRRLLDHPELARRLGEYGRAVVASSLSVEHVSSEIDAMVRDMISDR